MGPGGENGEQGLPGDMVRNVDLKQILHSVLVVSLVLTSMSQLNSYQWIINVPGTSEVPGGGGDSHIKWTGGARPKF